MSLDSTGEQLMAKCAPGNELTYTSLEEFIGAKVLVEGVCKAGGNPTHEKLINALATLRKHDVGGPSHLRLTIELVRVLSR